MLQRARERVEELVASYTPPMLPADVEQEIDAIMLRYASKYGMKKLPEAQGLRPGSIVEPTGGAASGDCRSLPADGSVMAPQNGQVAESDIE
jgi:hypothetical protein